MLAGFSFYAIYTTVDIRYIYACTNGIALEIMRLQGTYIYIYICIHIGKIIISAVWDHHFGSLSPLKPLDNKVMWCLRGFRRVLNWFPMQDAERQLYMYMASRTAVRLVVVVFPVFQSWLCKWNKFRVRQPLSTINTAYIASL